MTERHHFHFSLSCIGGRNGNPLQCSCLENPRDGGAWWAAVYAVSQSRTRLKRLSSSSSRRMCTAAWQFKSPDLDVTQTYIAFAFSCCMMNGHTISGSKQHTLLVYSFCESGIWALLQNLSKLSQVSAGQWSHSKV